MAGPTATRRIFGAAGMLLIGLLVCVPSDARAQAKPDFSGEWTVDRPAGRGGRGGPPPDMGSGWGTTITIVQDRANLTVEYVFFARGDLQPPLKFRYSLDGSETTNTVMLGRGIREQKSRTSWAGDTLVITTVHSFAHPETGQPMTSRVARRLSLESPASLRVESTIDGVLGGPATTTSTLYRKN